MNTELTDFLRRNGACAGRRARLKALGAETLADAWMKASPEDLIWMVTRQDVMDDEQRRLFLVMVLESIEDKLTDPRSKNILDKLRTKSPITDADAAAADAADADADAWEAARAAARAAAYAAAADASWEAYAAAYAAARAAAYAAARAAVRRKQARWIRSNFRLAELHTNNREIYNVR